MASLQSQPQGPKRALNANGKGHGGRMKKKQKLKGDANWPEGSHEEILGKEVEELLKDLDIADKKSPPELQTHIDIEITRQSSTGDGLAVHKESGSVLVVPFSIPGDVVTAKPFRSVDGVYFHSDFIKVVTPSPNRDDSLIKCQYFARCGGCQFQMTPYEQQLLHKKAVVENAYRFFSGMKPDQIPEIGSTLESPKQFEYRTKLTPHFDGMPGRSRKKLKPNEPVFKEVPPIGFMLKGTRKTIDIEDCPIGTPVLRKAMPIERKRVADTIHTFKNGATILLRESTERSPKVTFKSEVSQNQVVEEHDDHVDVKSCVTDNNGTSCEFVGDRIFVNPAGAFFQNNNSILEPFISHIRDCITSFSDSNSLSYLVDAYCGSGLFTITLSDLFTKSIGIDISESSIEFARKNAKLNNLPETQASFMAADAVKIFEKVDFPADGTVLVIDPPRKGCDKNFLRQLLSFGPKRVVYVSCNVHTQARDVGVLVNGMEDVGKGKYVLKSLRGMDFFPQSGHVEGLAILERKDEAIVSGDGD
jgi:tRNA (uracil-5-)-methyltransferase